MKVIPFSERVRKNRSGEEKTFLYRFCNKSDLESILLLQEAVVENLPHKELFVVTSREELEESLDKDVCICAVCDDRIVGFSLIIANRVTPRSLGHYLEYSDEQLQRCVSYDTTFVHPSYRGFGLQRRFISLRDRQTRRLGAEEALMSISPDNLHSLRNATGHGFQIIDRQAMYHGVSRFILRKSFGKTRLREIRRRVKDL